MLVNLGLYMRSSVVAKFLYLDELYRLIVGTPGVIFEFGVWWGQNLALLESLRAVYEPYNHTRTIVGFDTFTGYPSITPTDGTSPYAKPGAYATGELYEDYLTQLLDYHEQENVLSHLKKYRIVKGDVAQTAPAYLKEHPETIVALAYFDLQLYEPTKAVLESIKPYLTRGSVIALDELNSRDFPGETVALREVWDLDSVRIQRSRYLPDRSYIVIE